MKSKFIIIFVALAVFTGLVATTACATLLAHDGKVGCHKSKAADPGCSRVSQATCAMLPCQAAQGQVFLLPEPAFRRSDVQKEAAFHPCDASTHDSSVATLFPASMGKEVLKWPIASKPPSLFILNCSLVR